MIKLKNVVIHKYRCVEEEQSFSVEPDYTILVGVNESGKTSVLHAIASAQYFNEDSYFKYDIIRDYPRTQLKKAQSSEEQQKAITLTFELPDSISKEISDFLGYEYDVREYDLTKTYDNEEIISLKKDPDSKLFIESKLDKSNVSHEYKVEIMNDNWSNDYKGIMERMKEGGESQDSIELMEELNECLIKQDLSTTIYYRFIKPVSPKFMYYDEYYSLPSEVRLDNLNERMLNDDSLKTAGALVELAGIDVKKIADYNDFEGLIAELEATESVISKELFKYWQTNENLQIKFEVKPIEEQIPNNRNSKHIIGNSLHTRVSNRKRGVSLPLNNRSKGFNWFFSFLVWFRKVESDKNNTYIVLLDEPGLNLHGNAQADLLRFIEDISENYQVIYTTHSPFMIPLGSFHNVRTIVEKDDGAHISESIHENDSATLFPLQASLGYSIAQNLFISENNLLVEGPSDLNYIMHMSSILENNGMEGLDNQITIVPTSGADKVASFISLFRGNKLNIVCLLDTLTDAKSKDRLENLTHQNIIDNSDFIYFSEFLGSSYADIEDMFEKTEYVRWYNEAFQRNIEEKNLDTNIDGILKQLEQIDGKRNHYAPSMRFVKDARIEDLDQKTLNRFEKLFIKINQKFKSKNSKSKS